MLLIRILDLRHCFFMLTLTKFTSHFSIFFLRSQILYILCVTVSPQCCSVRYNLAFMMFLGFAVVYGLRVNLSVAMVAMVNTTGTQPSFNESESKKCPASSTTSNSSSENPDQPDGVSVLVHSPSHNICVKRNGSDGLFCLKARPQFLSYVMFCFTFHWLILMSLRYQDTHGLLRLRECCWVHFSLGTFSPRSPGATCQVAVVGVNSLEEEFWVQLSSPSSLLWLLNLGSVGCLL